MRSVHIMDVMMHYHTHCFFPKGELGWHANIPKSNVSMDKVDAYRDQHRTRDANNADTG
jgi:hypothetical protein